MNVKKIVYTAVGCLGLGLGAVGASCASAAGISVSAFSSDMFRKKF